MFILYAYVLFSGAPYPTFYSHRYATLAQCRRAEVVEILATRRQDARLEYITCTVAPSFP